MQGLVCGSAREIINAMTSKTRELPLWLNIYHHLKQHPAQAQAVLKPTLRRTTPRWKQRDDWVQVLFTVRAWLQSIPKNL